MTLWTVSIAGVSAPVEVYGGLTACKDYLGASASSGAVAFNALASDDEKAKRLVGATRLLDSYGWQGAADAFGGTTLQWPRSGITISGVTIDDPTQLATVNKAAFELAAILADDPDIASALDSGSNVRGLGAGSARVDFFRPQSLLDGNATVLPVVIARLMGRWLAGASGAAQATGVATGTSCRDDFNTCAEDKIGWPL